MSAALPLRRYQRDAIDAFHEKIKTEGNRLALVLATGLGKTVIIGHASKEHLEANPDQRVLVLVHTDELVRQAATKIKSIAPHLSIGIVKAAQNEVTADVIVASVQTLRSERRRAQLQRVGLVIVDECHHATASTYRMILDHYGCMSESGTPTMGVTATLMRGDGGPLGEIWQAVAFARTIGYGVRQGYLIPPRGRAVEVPDLDLASVKRTKSDFREGELGTALADSLAPELIAQAYVEHAGDRSGILFCPTVASATVMAEAMNAAGIKTEVIHGGLPMDERRAILDRLESGATQVLANCMVLTEGFDSPRVSCVVVARPTRSKGLYIQMVGRGLRVDPLRPYDEQDCLVLDVVGSAGQHDLCSIADLSDKPLDPKEARKGKTLLDLEDEFDAGEGVEPDAPDHWSGPVDVREFDPLAARTDRRWGKTEGGVYFAPAGPQAFVFIVGGAVQVCPCCEGVGTHEGWSDCTQQHGTELSPLACVACEGSEGRRGGHAVVWCTRSGTPYLCASRMHDAVCTPMHGRAGGITEHRGLDLETAFGWAEDLAVDMGESLVPARRITQRMARAADVGRARALGIDVPPGIRHDKLSALVDKVIASRVIDKWAPKVLQALGHTESRESAA